MERILNYTISAADEGMIVLDFLRKQDFPDIYSQQ